MESIKQLHGDVANRTLRVFRRLSRFPLGKLLYSKLVNYYAPYTGTIRAVVTNLIPGLCTTEMKDRRSIQNHLHTVHAIALCNLCEMTMGLMLDATIPSHLRWIPKGMNVQYVKKARGKLSVEAGSIRMPLRPRTFPFRWKYKICQEISLSGPI